MNKCLHGFFAFLVAASLAAVSAGTAAAREQVQIAGSSTVLPYASIVAEAFGADLPPDTIRPFAKDLQRYVAESCFRQVKKTGTAYVK